MDFDERAIKLYLKSYPGQYVSPRIISRRVGDKRRYHTDPMWVLPILSRMTEKGILEADAQGHYRLKKVVRDGQKRTWMAPHLQHILERSSKDFAVLHDLGDDPDETG